MNTKDIGDNVGEPISYFKNTNQSNDNILVSIIIPAYNAHNTIKRTLCSICMQENIDQIEIVLVDDKSDLDYEDIIKHFTNMVKITYVKMLKNGGPGAARQVGFDHSVGKYVMWMDADDTLVSADTINVLMKVMEERQMDCVYGKFLEQTENGTIHPHEIHMVWMFGKLYRRSFLEKYNIRFNTSLSNEDTGFNCVVKGCALDKIWYIPKDVYIWHFKPNSITRINQGMYGSDSGYKGYIDNMIWQIKQLENRFVNKNYILHEIISIMCILYFFHEENKYTCPMNEETSMNWIRGYYDKVYKDNEKYITEIMFNQTFAEISNNNGVDLIKKGMIPRTTIFEFMDEVRAKPYVENSDETIRGATPAGYIPPVTSRDWPVEIKKYNEVEPKRSVNDDTNISRYFGMKNKLGINRSERDYDMNYDGSQGLVAPSRNYENGVDPIIINDDNDRPPIIISDDNDRFIFEDTDEKSFFSGSVDRLRDTKK